MKPLFIIVPILLIGGVVGAGAMGVVQIPGISPKKAEAKANAQYGEETEATAEESTEPAVADSVDRADQTDETSQTDQGGEAQADTQPTVTVTTTEAAQPAIDAEQGAKALAKYWDEIETTKLIAITDTYKEADLAQILYFMNKKKVAEMLSRIPASRAANLSRELQRLASVVKTAP